MDILRAHDWLAPKTSWPAAVSRSKRRSGGRDTRGQILLSESNDRRPLAPVPPGNATNAPTLLARALVRPDALGRFEKQEPPPPPLVGNLFKNDGSSERLVNVCSSADDYSTCSAFAP